MVNIIKHALVTSAFVVYLPMSTVLDRIYIMLTVINTQINSSRSPKGVTTPTERRGRRGWRHYPPSKVSSLTFSLTHTSLLLLTAPYSTPARHMPQSSETHLARKLYIT